MPLILIAAEFAGFDNSLAPSEERLRGALVHCVVHVVTQDRPLVSPFKWQRTPTLISLVLRRRQAAFSCSIATGLRERESSSASSDAQWPLKLIEDASIFANMFYHQFLLRDLQVGKPDRPQAPRPSLFGRCRPANELSASSARDNK